jgi:hypothetical protein
MSQPLNKLVQVAVAGRYKKSPWGLVPLPRRVRRFPAGLDPDYNQSVKYEALVRCLNRQKPAGFPVGSHSLMEVESHLREVSALEQTFECSYGLELLARQADTYVGAFKHNVKNASPSLTLGAIAFREVWEIVVARLAETCPKCGETVKKRLALNGFVT